MAGILLDTHILFWALANPSKLSSAQKHAIQSISKRYVSATSIYEMGQKIRIGKWPEAEDVWKELNATLAEANTQILPVDLNIARRAAELNWRNRDPFDRMIVATSLVHDLKLVSSDRAFIDLPNEVIR